MLLKYSLGKMPFEQDTNLFDSNSFMHNTVRESWAMCEEDEQSQRRRRRRKSLKEEENSKKKKKNSHLLYLLVDDKSEFFILMKSLVQSFLFKIFCFYNSGVKKGVHLALMEALPMPQLH